MTNIEELLALVDFHEERIYPNAQDLRRGIVALGEEVERERQRYENMRAEYGKLEDAAVAWMQKAKDRDALRAENARLKVRLSEWPSLECPCCGEEAIVATLFADGQETTCGCGGVVSVDPEADEDRAWVRIDIDEDCPKCTPATPGAGQGAETETAR